MSGWIQTVSGARFDFDRVAGAPGGIRLADIAHALGNICRFGGHCVAFYSVAQHSVEVSDRLSIHGRDVAVAGLLHDAAEAYVGDVVQPLTHRLGDEFAFLERVILSEIFGVARVPSPSAETWALVRAADLQALMTERRDLLARPPEPWGAEFEAVTPWPERIDPWPPRTASALWAARAQELGLIV